MYKPEGNSMKNEDGQANRFDTLKTTLKPAKGELACKNPAGGQGSKGFPDFTMQSVQPCRKDRGTGSASLIGFRNVGKL